jgi:ParB-like chromosome segregation protein Spo0J
MPDIALERLRPNPYRDFELHPLDPVQVAKLKASIGADGFWASVVAREAGDGYEIAFGHHRIEAARELGLDTVPIEVRDLADWQMVRMLASENATQRGSTAAASLDAIAAICKVLAYNLLRWGDEATLSRNMEGVRIDFPTCRGMLEAGQGIGGPCVKAFAPEGSFSRTQIDENLAVLKDSGRMATIIAEAAARADVELRAEQEAAEAELREAEAREAKAHTKRERETAARDTRKAKQTAGKKRKATQGAAKAVAKARKPITYDARCNQLFRIEAHAAEFRRIVRGETFQSFLPLAGQFEFAKKIIASIKENAPAKHLMTAIDIRRECWSRIETDLGMSTYQLRTAPERPFLNEIRDGFNLIRRGLSDAVKGVALLSAGLRKGETLDAKQRAALDRAVAISERVASELAAAQEPRVKLVSGRE